jgi:transcriptional regulator with XRE-family HTH domain
MNDIGQRIKQLRSQKKLPLKEVAARTGLTSSFLSQLENGMTAPSVDSLRRIAKALEVGVGDLFQEERASEFVFLRRSPQQQARPKDPIGNYELLASGVMDIRILPMLLTLDPGEELPADRSPQGEEMLGVAITGRIEIGVNGKSFTLEAGDSIYLVNPAFSYQKNQGPERVSFLWNVLRV